MEGLCKITVVMLALMVTANAALTKRRSCAAKYQGIKDHTACLAPSPGAKDSGVSEEDKKLILDEHKKMRQSVKPAATNMREMTWDDDLANTAQAWADNCKFAHDRNEQRVEPGRFGSGQNLAMNWPAKSWKVATDGWYNEIKDFKYGQNPTGVVGHYTQCVWAETTKIGCGYAKCPNMHLYVCNYGPAGNNAKTKYTPWKTGSSCADCSGNCKDKLCDCGGAVCLNGGTMDLKTCTCSCPKSMMGDALEFFKAPYCKLECAGSKDHDACGSQLTESMCMYSNVRPMCPHMCGDC